MQLFGNTPPFFLARLNVSKGGKEREQHGGKMRRETCDLAKQASSFLLFSQVRCGLLPLVSAPGWYEFLSHSASHVTDTYKVLQHLTIILNTLCKQENGASTSYY